jgi:hypothetical protein
VTAPTFEQFSEQIKSNADKAVVLHILRDGHPMTITVTPRTASILGENRAAIGVELDSPTTHHGVLGSIEQGFILTADTTAKVGPVGAHPLSRGTTRTLAGSVLE